MRLSWQASHSGELSAEPADSSLGEVGASGVKTVRPKATTTYKLSVSSLFASASDEAKVTVPEVPAAPTSIGGSSFDEGSGCAPGRVWVTARVEPGRFDPRLRVSLVSSSDGRSYRVEHASRSAVVAAGGPPSDALRDLPIAGAWRIETDLRPGENCSESPQSLAVNVGFVCAD